MTDPLDGPPVPAPDAPPPGTDPGRTRDGGWASTAAQGLVLTRWVAAELAAQRLEGFAFATWITGLVGMGIAVVGLLWSWPLIVLGALVLLAAIAGRLALALGAWVLRRLALPRRARHLRVEAAAARVRLTEALAATGVPISLGTILRFLIALVRGRRPHAGVATNVRALAGRLDQVAEIDRLRQALAAAAPPPAWLARRAGRDGDRSEGDR